jgi:hypothetical protein
MKTPPYGPHQWRPSTLGHGESQCALCLATNREIAATGDMNRCEKNPTDTFAAAPSKTARLELNIWCEAKLAELFLQGVKQGWIDLTASEQIEADALALLEQRFNYQPAYGVHGG